MGWVIGGIIVVVAFAVVLAVKMAVLFARGLILVAGALLSAVLSLFR